MGTLGKCSGRVHDDIPIGLPTAVLLGLLGVLARVTVFGKVTRQMLFGGGSAVSQAGMILVVVLDGVSVPGRHGSR